MKTLIRIIDAISEWTGRITSWACVGLVIVLTYEVIMRYVFSAPTIWSFEISTMLGLTIIVLGLAYTHRHQGLVRIDVLWSLLPLRGKAIADLICASLLFFPLMIALIYFSVWRLQQSISINEVLTQTYWYPPSWPIRAVMVVGFCLFVLQGLAQFTRDLYLVLRNKPL